MAKRTIAMKHGHSVHNIIYWFLSSTWCYQVTSFLLTLLCEDLNILFVYYNLYYHVVKLYFIGQLLLHKLSCCEVVSGACEIIIFHHFKRIQAAKTD